MSILNERFLRLLNNLKNTLGLFLISLILSFSHFICSLGFPFIMWEIQVFFSIRGFFFEIREISGKNVGILYQTIGRSPIIRYYDKWENVMFFWILWEKITSWACLLGLGLKLLVHWNALLIILLKSLFKWLAEVVIFCTMEKRGVSSAKSLAVVDKLSDRSLI